MASNIYVSDETKELLEKCSKADKRKQEAEISYLCERRLQELKEAGNAIH